MARGLKITLKRNGPMRVDVNMPRGGECDAMAEAFLGVMEALGVKADDVHEVPPPQADGEVIAEVEKARG